MPLLKVQILPSTLGKMLGPEASLMVSGRWRPSILDIFVFMSHSLEVNVAPCPSSHCRHSFTMFPLGGLRDTRG